MRLKRITQRRILIVLCVLFCILNLAAFASAYSMTHFTQPGELGLGQPRPFTSGTPSDVGLKYEQHRISIGADEWVDTWFIPTEVPPQGTVLLFHGNGGDKAGQLLYVAEAFLSLGYDTWLVDFRGVGGSSGQTSTLGVREGGDVALSLAYAKEFGSQPPFVLYGASMGSAAILRAIAHHSIFPDGIILELPFVTMLEAVRKRIVVSGMPTFPMAELIVFWGSVQHGFNGFAHNPLDYASKVTMPTLLMHGEQDRWVTIDEINQLFAQLAGDKQLVTFPTAGHVPLLGVDAQKWTMAIEQLLEKARAEVNS